ncbi:hypothetical protein BD779DRAFT_1581555 [Infundibulicybe gibba]|nr:hypothetical protein BD779DRAFT_1581555 [Infundibulicybe gibba]
MDCGPRMRSPDIRVARNRAIAQSLGLSHAKLARHGPLHEDHAAQDSRRNPAWAAKNRRSCRVPPNGSVGHGLDQSLAFWDLRRSTCSNSTLRTRGLGSGSPSILNPASLAGFSTRWEEDSSHTRRGNRSGYRGQAIAKHREAYGIMSCSLHLATRSQWPHTRHYVSCPPRFLAARRPRLTLTGRARSEHFLGCVSCDTIAEHLLAQGPRLPQL